MSDKMRSTCLGIKGLSDSVKITTQGFIDGASAFLARVCLPAAEELVWRSVTASPPGERETQSECSVMRTVHLSNNPNPADRLSPRLAHIAIEEASWIDDEPDPRHVVRSAGIIGIATRPH